MDIAKSVPPEIWSEILGKLDLQDLLAASLTCKWMRYLTSFFIEKKASIVIKDDEYSIVSTLMNSDRNYQNWVLKQVSIKPNTEFQPFWDKVSQYVTSLTLISIDMANIEFSKLLSKCPKMKQLNLIVDRGMFFACYFSTEVDFTPAHQILRNLKSFCLHGSRYLTDNSFENLTHTMSSLESFTMSAAQVSYGAGMYRELYAELDPDQFSPTMLTMQKLQVFIARNSPTLKKLVFTASAIDCISLRNIAQLPELQLHTIDVSYCSNVTNVGFEALLRYQTRLTDLNLSSCQRVTDLTIKSIAENLPNLKNLNISACLSVTAEGVKELAKLIHLESMDISCLEIRQPSCFNVALAEVDRPCLKKLDCSFLPINAKTIFDMTTRVPNLCELILMKCITGVSDRSLREICRNLRKLTKLDLTGCSSLTDYGLSGRKIPVMYNKKTPLATLKEGSRTKLGLKWGDPYRVPLGSKAERAIIEEEEEEEEFRCINEEVVEEAEDICGLHLLPRLDTLILSGCYRMTDLTLQHSFQFPLIRSLDLTGCSILGESALIRVFANCRSIEVLDLSRCRMMTDQVVLVIGQFLRRLRELTLDFCPYLTDDSLDSLSNCTSLRSLSMASCSKITRKELTKFYYKHPQLTQLISPKGKVFVPSDLTTDFDEENNLCPKDSPFMARMMNMVFHR